MVCLPPSMPHSPFVIGSRRATAAAASLILYGILLAATLGVACGRRGAAIFSSTTSVSPPCVGLLCRWVAECTAACLRCPPSPLAVGIAVRFCYAQRRVPFPHSIIPARMCHLLWEPCRMRASWVCTPVRTVARVAGLSDTLPIFLSLARTATDGSHYERIPGQIWALRCPKATLLEHRSNYPDLLSR